MSEKKITFAELRYKCNNNRNDLYPIKIDDKIYVVWRQLGCTDMQYALLSDYISMYLNNGRITYEYDKWFPPSFTEKYSEFEIPTKEEVTSVYIEEANNQLLKLYNRQKILYNNLLA